MKGDIILPIYLGLLILLPVIIPILLHDQLKRRIKSSVFLAIVEICLGLVVLFSLGMIPLIIFLPDRPTITKQISSKYYFTEQEYVFTAAKWGKHLDLYQKRQYWFDKHLGHIKMEWQTEDINTQILPASNPDFKHLILKSGNDKVLDTALSFKKEFEIDY